MSVFKNVIHFTHQSDFYDQIDRKVFTGRLLVIMNRATFGRMVTFDHNLAYGHNVGAFKRKTLGRKK